MPVHAISVDGNPANSATGDAPSSSPYLSYVALMNQSGIDAPVATVLNGNDSNYLGDIVWSYNGPGGYTGTLASAFPLAKTYANCYNNIRGVDMFLGSNETGEPSSELFFSIEDRETVVPTDGKLYNTAIEIRVYQ